MKSQTTTTTRERDKPLLLLPYLQRRHPIVRAELKLVSRGFAQVSHQGLGLQRPTNVYFAGLQPQKSPSPRVASGGASDHLNFVNDPDVKSAVDVDLMIYKKIYGAS